MMGWSPNNQIWTKEMQTGVSTACIQAFARLREHRSTLSKGIGWSGFHSVNDHSLVIFYFFPLGHFWLPTFLLFSICLMDTHSFKAREVPFSSWRPTLPLRSLVHDLSLILVKSLYTNRSQFACCDSISYMIFAYNLLLFPVTCTNIFMDWNRLEATPVYLLPPLILCSLPPSTPQHPQEPDPLTAPQIFCASHLLCFLPPESLNSLSSLVEALFQLLFASSSFRSISKYCYFKGNFIDIPDKYLPYGQLLLWHWLWLEFHIWGYLINICFFH